MEVSYFSVVSSHILKPEWILVLTSYRAVSLTLCWSHQHFNAAAAKSLQSSPTLCDPTDGSPPGFPSLGFSRQEHWSGLPFPSPMHESEKWKGSLSRVDSSDPMDCSLPGSSVHGILQAKVLEWGAIAFSVGSHSPPQKLVRQLHDHAFHLQPRVL